MSYTKAYEALLSKSINGELSAYINAAIDLYTEENQPISKKRTRDIALIQGILENNPNISYKTLRLHLAKLFDNKRYQRGYFGGSYLEDCINAALDLYEEKVLKPKPATPAEKSRKSTNSETSANLGSETNFFISSENLAQGSPSAGTAEPKQQSEESDQLKIRRFKSAFKLALMKLYVIPADQKKNLLRILEKINCLQAANKIENSEEIKLEEIFKQPKEGLAKIAENELKNILEEFKNLTINWKLLNKTTIEAYNKINGKTEFLDFPFSYDLKTLLSFAIQRYQDIHPEADDLKFIPKLKRLIIQSHNDQSLKNQIENFFSQKGWLVSPLEQACLDAIANFNEQQENGQYIRTLSAKIHYAEIKDDNIPYETPQSITSNTINDTASDDDFFSEEDIIFSAPENNKASKKKIVIALHGLGDSVDTWDALAKDYIEAGFDEFITYDHAGHGFDEHRGKKLDLQQMQFDFYKFLEQYHQDPSVGEIVLLGHSLGGAVILNSLGFINNLSAKENLEEDSEQESEQQQKKPKGKNKIAGIHLINPACKQHPVRENAYVALTYPSHKMADRRESEKANRDKAGVSRIGGGDVVAEIRAFNNYTEKARQNLIRGFTDATSYENIHGKIKVVVAADDKMVSISNSEELQKNYPGAITIVNRGGHNLHQTGNSAQPLVREAFLPKKNVINPANYLGKIHAAFASVFTESDVDTLFTANGSPSNRTVDISLRDVGRSDSEEEPLLSQEKPAPDNFTPTTKATAARATLLQPETNPLLTKADAALKLCLSAINVNNKFTVQKEIKTKNAITKLTDLANQNTSIELISLYPKLITTLRQQLGAIQRQLYFSSNSSSDDSVNLLTQLQQIFSPTNLDALPPTNLNDLLQGAKEKIAAHSKDDYPNLTEYGEIKDKTNIEKPSILKFWSWVSWDKRDQLREIEVKNRIKHILQNKNSQPPAKQYAEIMKAAKENCDFFDSDHNKKILTIAAKAAMYCLLKAFSRGLFDVAALIVKLEILSKETGNNSISNFAHLLKGKYIEQLKTNDTTVVSSYATMLKDQLRSVKSTSTTTTTLQVVDQKNTPDEDKSKEFYYMQGNKLCRTSGKELFTANESTESMVQFELEQVKSRSYRCG